MKYFLFVSFNSGLNHNALYESLVAVRESLEQLIVDEGLNIEGEDLLGAEALEKHFELNDDYVGGLSNGDWFHIQETSDESIHRMSGMVSV